MSKRGKKLLSMSHVKMLPTDEDSERVHKTLDLSDVMGSKPCINSIMPTIMPRIEREESIRLAEEARKWAKKHRNRLGNVLLNLWNNGDEDNLSDLPFDMEDEDDYFDYLHASSSSRLRHLDKGKKGKTRRAGGKLKKGSKRYVDEDLRLTYGYNDFPGADDELEGENPANSFKHIVYYPDIDDEMHIVEFDNIFDFNNYCAAHGFTVPCSDYENIVNNEEIHCCLDPIDKEYGEYTIITDTSYGGLYWSVSDDMTKLDAIGSKSSPSSELITGKWTEK